MNINKILNIKLILKIISFNLFLVALSLVSCVAVALYYFEDYMPFIYASFVSLVIGITMFLFSKEDEEKDLKKKDAYFVVTASWILMSVVGALPYVFSNSIPSFIDAVFESVSGFSTTGASILTDVEILPKSILFWRSLTHWIGGIGIIVLVIIIMPSLKIGGYHLFSSESSFQDKIKPRIKAIGKRLLWIYILLTFFEIVLLIAGNMSVFDSVCHSFGTVATGGFSTKNTSIAGYSPYIQYIITLFMFLAGTNFVIHYYLIKRKFSKIAQNEEFVFYVILTSIIGFIITFSLFYHMNKPFEESFREAFFQVVTIITCTGFATADYLQWPTYAWAIIFFSMFLGACTGSTTGGIKMVRHLILFKNIKNTFRQKIHHNAILPIKINNNVLSSENNSSTLSFIFLYLMIFVIGSVLLILSGVDWQSSAGATATCMAGIGPGIGTVGPVSNFAHLPDFSKIVLSFIMIIGRLEIYTFMILFTKSYWKY